MRRHVAEPFDAGGLHGGVGVQALGDGVGDDGLAFFLQQFDQPPLLGHQRVDLRRLAVEERGDRGLLGERRKRQLESLQASRSQMRLIVAHQLPKSICSSFEVADSAEDTRRTRVA